MQTDQATMQDSDKSVTAYLASLKWDGKPRLDRWLIDCAGAEDTAYVRAVSRGMLLAAVRRARNPGCRFDQMPILEGPQGCGKSRALRILAGENGWSTHTLHENAFRENAYFIRAPSEGTWIVEAPDLESMMSRGRVATLKACLSRQRDEARLAYGHKSERVLRQFVIIGTTNETLGYFRDETGNRRFWPVRVQRFNLEKLRADRDQLWAEAAAIDMRGEPLDLSHYLDAPETLPSAEETLPKQGNRLVITLAAVCQNSDVEAVMQAVRLIRGVMAVERQKGESAEHPVVECSERQGAELEESFELQDSDLFNAHNTRSGASLKVRLPCPLTSADLLLLKIRTACESLSLTHRDLKNWTDEYFQARAISEPRGLLSKSEALLRQILGASEYLTFNSRCAVSWTSSATSAAWTRN